MKLTPEQRPASQRPKDTHGTATPERLWSTAQLAEYLGVPVKTIHQWRYMQKGPRGFRVGRHLRFRPADVRAWEDALLDEASPRSCRLGAHERPQPRRTLHHGGLPPAYGCVPWRRTSDQEGPMGSIRRRPGRPSPWEAVHRDPNGRQQTRAFRRKVDAQRWLDEQTAAIVTGQYISPTAGR